MNETGTVLLVEDDQNVLRINRRILEREGFRVLCAETLATARALLALHQPDVWVLDIMLPDGNGRELCEEIRGSITAPVLFLTALDEQADVLEGLRAGGNDYITKPYDVDVFLARVKAQHHLAQMNRQRADDRVFTRGPLTLDMVAARALINGEDLLLKPREFAALLYLAKNAGRNIPTKCLYEAAWMQPMIGDSGAVKTVVSRLRKKLEGSGYTITSARGEGYCFDKTQ